MGSNKCLHAARGLAIPQKTSFKSVQKGSGKAQLTEMQSRVTLRIWQKKICYISLIMKH